VIDADLERVARCDPVGHQLVVGHEHHRRVGQKPAWQRLHPFEVRAQDSGIHPMLINPLPV
jgi:hypothetical protein